MSFISLRPSLRFTSFINPLRFTSYVSYNLFVTLILSSIRCTSFLSFLIYFLPFVSTLPFRSAVPLVSTLSFHSLLSSFRFNSLLSFVTSFLSFQLWHPVPYCFPSFQVVHCWPWSRRFPTWMIITKAFNLTTIKIHLSPSAEKHDTDRTKSAGNLVKQCQGFAIHRR
jgi:hypothetical protein